MTYFAFLGLFLVIPIILLAGLNFFDAQKGKKLPASWVKV